VRNAFEHSFDEVLSLWPRNQGGGRDLEQKPEELLLAGNVLDQLVAEAAFDSGLVGCKLLGREHAIVMRQQGCAVDVKNVQQQQLRVALGVVAKVGVSGNLVRSLSEGLT